MCNLDWSVIVIQVFVWGFLLTFFGSFIYMTVIYPFFIEKD